MTTVLERMNLIRDLRLEISNAGATRKAVLFALNARCLVKPKTMRRGPYAGRLLPIGSTWVSTSTLAGDAGVEERSVRRALDWLEKLGVIRRERTLGKPSLIVFKDPVLTRLATSDKRSGVHPGQKIRPTPDKRSEDPGSSVQKPRTEDPTNRSLTDQITEPRAPEDSGAAAIQRVTPADVRAQIAELAKIGEVKPVATESLEERRRAGLEGLARLARVDDETKGAAQ